MSIDRTRVVRFLAVITVVAAVPVAGGGTVPADYVGADGGTWNLARNWSPAVVPFNGNGGETYGATIGNGSEVLLDMTATLDALTIAAGNQLTFGNSFDLTFVVGPVTNDGDILLSSAGSATDFLVGAPEIMLTGSGTLRLGGALTNRINGSGFGFDLVHGANHTIRGGGNVGVNTIDLVNDGLVIADDLSTALRLDMNSVLVNAGILQAQDGATLAIFPSNLTNTDGLIRALDASFVDVSGVTITGGELATEGSGLIRIIANSTFLDGVTITGPILAIDGVDPRVLSTITNESTLTLASEGSATELVLASDPVTFTGSGAIVMGPNANNRIGGLNFNNVLINDVDHTIRGSGNIGSNVIDFINDGLITADEPTVGVVIDPNFEATNNATIQAENGATLTIQPATYDNTAGLIAALDESFVDLAGPTILGGELGTEGTGLLRVTANTTRLEDLVISGPLLTTDGRDPQVVGTITNTSTITLDSTGSATDLTLASNPVVFTGDGEVIMGPSPSNRITGLTFNSILVNDVDHTIRGAGNLGLNVIDLTNDGLISADDPVGLTLDLNFIGTNNATIEATNGATLTIAPATIDNTNGVIHARDGSRVDLSGTTIFGGELATEGTGLVRIVANTTTLEDLLLSGPVETLDSIDPRIVGTIVNDNTFTLASEGSATVLTLASNPAMLDGTGELVMGPGTGAGINSLSFNSVLVNGTDHTIRGAGNLGTNVADLENNGLITANEPGTTLVLDVNALGTNNATIRAENGATLRINAGTIDNTNGIVQALDGSLVELAGPTITGGEWTTEGSGELRIVSNTTTLADLALTGTTVVNNTIDPRITGTIVNDGTFTLAAEGGGTVLTVASNPATLDGTGELVLGPGTGASITALSFNSVLVQETDHTIVGNGNIGSNVADLENHGTIISDSATGLTIDVNASLLNTGTMLVNGPDSVMTIQAGGMDQQGTVTIEEGAQLTRSTDYTQTSGATTVDGTLTVNSGVADIAGGVIRGNGIVSGSVVVSGTGAAAPGTSTGVLTVDTYQQSGDGALVVEFASFDGPGIGHDVLAVNGTATLGGVLEPLVTGGFEPAPGSQFTFLTAEKIVGEFLLVEGCGEFVVEYTDTEAILTFVRKAILGDLNCDGVVDGVDLGLLLARWGDMGGGPADLNDDEVVNGADLGILLGNWS